jgi:hypothetical protein
MEFFTSSATPMNRQAISRGLYICACSLYFLFLNSMSAIYVAHPIY